MYLKYIKFDRFGHSRQVMHIGNGINVYGFDVFVFAKYLMYLKYIKFDRNGHSTSRQVMHIGNGLNVSGGKR